MHFFFLLLMLPLFAEDRSTSHQIELGSTSIAYTATVGSIPVQNEKGEEMGKLSYTSYIQDNTSSNRPLTFAFNGGPGSSSIWLHFGAFGPRRVLSPEEGQPGIPPYHIEDNLETLLDCTDLIFVDPIGTGYSRIDDPKNAQPYYEVSGDIKSIGNFISDFLTKFKRWNSPIYIAGESYGTLRACGLADYLQEEKGIYLNGLLLISCVLDYQIFNYDHPASYFLYLPTYMTTAWYHGRYRPDATIEEIAEEARQFSYRSYAPALLNPSILSQDEKEDLYRKLSAATGLPLSTIKKEQGLIRRMNFFVNFFSEEKKRIGRLDTRIIGDYADCPNYDPSLASISGIYTGAFNQYMLSELNAPSDAYVVFSDDAYFQWHSNKNFSDPINVLPALRNALVRNPSLKIYVGCGYYDCATPFAAAEYYFNHLELPPSYSSQVQFAYYEGGHMYYLNPLSRIKMKNDLTHFYSSGL